MFNIVCYGFLNKKVTSCLCGLYRNVYMVLTGVGYKSDVWFVGQGLVEIIKFADLIVLRQISILYHLLLFVENRSVVFRSESYHVYGITRNAS